jgi:hypothetical protein
VAVRSEYPTAGKDGDPIVRSDPLTIAVDINRKVDGVKTPIDITGWFWRAHIRRSPNAALVTEFSFDVDTPPGGTVPNRLLMSLAEDQTALLKTGMVFDLEQLTGHATPTTIRTWWICTRMWVAQDVSHA